MKSILRFDGNGIAYAAISMSGSFHTNTSFSFQVVGNYRPKEIYEVLQKIIKARNTNPLDAACNEYSYFDQFTLNVCELEFNYLGNGNASIVVNKCRVLFHGEVIKQFRIAVNKLKEAAVYAQRIDWLVSGDDGEGSFQFRLKKDLENLRLYDVGAE